MTTLERVQGVLRRELELDPARVTPRFDLYHQVFVEDSLDMAELAASLEAEFEVELTHGEIDQVRLVRDLVDLIDGKLSGTAPGEGGTRPAP